MDRRIAFRSIFIIIPLWGIIAATGVLVSSVINDYALHYLITNEEAALKSAQKVLTFNIRNNALDLEFISELPDLKIAINNPVAENLRRAEQTIIAFSNSQKVYDQIRWIDETGKERIRINMMAGHAVRVPEAELQDKSNRYYFVDTINGPAEAIYASALDLNIEGGQIEVPFKPVMRFAKKLYDQTGQLKGIAVLNLDVSRMLNRFLETLGPASNNTSLLNAKGFWLQSPNSQDEWGFMFGKSETLLTRHPKVAQQIWSSDAGSTVDGDQLWTWQTTKFGEELEPDHQGIKIFRPPEHGFWKIVSTLPLSRQEGLITRERQLVFYYSLALMIASGIAVLLYMTRKTMTERARALEIQRREAEEEARFELLITSSPNGMLVTDAQGKILHVNNQLAALLGYTVEQLKRLNVDDLVPDYSAPKHAQLRHSFTQRPAVRKLGNGGDLAAKRADGALVPVEISLAPFQLQNQLYVLANVVDISQRKANEEAMNALNASLELRVKNRTLELEAANKELEAFAYAVSHDLRAPLRGLMGFSTALEEDCANLLDDTGLDHLHEIKRASKSMAAMIDGLLTLSRSTQTTIQRTAIDLSQLAKQIATELSTLDPTRLVDWQIADNLQTHGDSRMIEAALRNLLENAWKYSSKTENPIIRLYEMSLEGKRRFVISDNGAGFDMSHADRLFKPFQRLHRQDEFSGQGIGLATVMRIVKRHGGSMGFESAPNQGATFWFSFEPDEPNHKNKGNDNVRPDSAG